MIGTGLLLCSLLSGLFGGGRISEQARQNERFDRMITAWSENVRTNTNLMTHAQFRDTVIVPFVSREVKNPFVDGGEEADKPWAEEGNLLFQRGLRAVCDTWPSAFYPMICGDATELVKRGCRDPFIRIMSAIEPGSGFRNGKAKEELSRIERELEGKPHCGFLRALIFNYRQRWWYKPEDRDELAHRFIRWIKEENFSSDDEVVLYYLVNSLTGVGAPGVFDEFHQFQWAAKLEESKMTLEEGSKATGDGVAASITQKGWRTLADKTFWSLKSLEEAEKIVPNRPETLLRKLCTICSSRRGKAKEMDGLFKKILRFQVDPPYTLGVYLWYRLYPRWVGDRNYENMLHFAESCYNTGRHDTVLPFLYAEIQCRYVRDANIDPQKYFRENPTITDRCLDVCQRQMTNEFATARARLLAPYVASAVAYYAGRYDLTNVFAQCSEPYSAEDVAEEIFSDWRIFHIYYALSGASRLKGGSSAFCIDLQRKFDTGKYREVIEQIEALPDSEDGDSYAFTQFIGYLHENALMKTDFAAGKKVRARLRPCYPGWENLAFWREGDWKWKSDSDRFDWWTTLTWRAGIPKQNELTFTVSPNGNANDQHVLVISRFVHEESHYRPINGLPYFTFLWEKDRLGLLVRNKYTKMFDLDDLADVIWVPAASTDRKVRIVNRKGTVSVFVGDAEKPVYESKEFAAAIRRSPKIGYLRIRGKNICISDIAIQKPQ